MSPEKSSTRVDVTEELLFRVTRLFPYHER